jgi:hypothetical protein
MELFIGQPNNGTSGIRGGFIQRSGRSQPAGRQSIGFPVSTGGELLDSS